MDKISFSVIENKKQCMFVPTCYFLKILFDTHIVCVTLQAIPSLNTR